MGASVQLDLDRIAKLQGLLGADLGEIVTSLIASMNDQIDLAQRALASGRLQDVTQPAHRCRNDALMVGAQPLLTALTALEAASRDGRLRAAQEAAAQLRAVWPKTREQLERAAAGSP